MGIKFIPSREAKNGTYKYTSKTLNLEFKAGEVYENVPKDIEDYLLATGRFFFVQTNLSQKIPSEINAADRNRELMEAGIINGKGERKKFLRGHQPEYSGQKNETIERELTLDVDESGDEIINEVRKPVQLNNPKKHSNISQLRGAVKIKRK